MYDLPLEILSSSLHITIVMEQLTKYMYAFIINNHNTDLSFGYLGNEITMYTKRILIKLNLIVLILRAIFEGLVVVNN